MCRRPRPRTVRSVCWSRAPPGRWRTSSPPPAPTVSGSPASPCRSPTWKRSSSISPGAPCATEAAFMRKLWAIGRKDLIVLFRDRAALILMLAAPLALTVGPGLVTGGFSGGQTGLRGIPLVVGHLAPGPLGAGLADLL